MAFLSLALGYRHPGPVEARRGGWATLNAAKGTNWFEFFYSLGAAKNFADHAPD